jgi:hypothetical protein
MASKAAAVEVSSGSSAPNVSSTGEVRGRVKQRLMLVLAVQLDEPRRQFLQRSGRGQGAVDESAAPALRGDLAAYQELFPAVLENRLDRGDVLASANQVPGCPPPSSRPTASTSIDLPAPGLARQDVQARVEFDLNRVDDRQVLDAQEAKHGESERTPIVT